MKKTFHVIVILITLSLLGLFALQASWLNNLLEIRNVEFYNKVDRATILVVSNMMEEGQGNKRLRFPRRGGLTFNPDFHLHILKPPTVDQRFSVKEIEELYKRAFDQVGLGSLRFEFAVLNEIGEVELSSRDFLVKYNDSITNKQLFLPITPQGGSDYEGLMANEVLVTVVEDYKQQIWASMKWPIIGSIVFMFVILSAFFVTIRSLLNQKKLSEIKSDFINNMTHEFKTPLATISLAVDAIRNEKVQSDPEKIKYFSGIVKEENIRMNKHVETILQAALMEKQELKLNLEKLHLHDIVQQALDNHQLQLRDKQGEVQLNLNASRDLVEVDDVHFTNLVSNLIDNAIKYSKDQLLIRITTHSTSKQVVLRVEDNGIGMNKETLKRIFEKFYRAHTGNLHNVKGFGLGMSYVRTVIDAHKGRIKVDSVLGKGSTFIVEMPLASEKES